MNLSEKNIIQYKNKEYRIVLKENNKILIMENVGAKDYTLKYGYGEPVDCKYIDVNDKNIKLIKNE
jgi:hypothetical protein